MFQDVDIDYDANRKASLVASLQILYRGDGIYRALDEMVGQPQRLAVLLAFSSSKGEFCPGKTDECLHFFHLHTLENTELQQNHFTSHIPSLSANSPFQ